MPSQPDFIDKTIWLIMLDKAQLNFFSRFSPSKHKPISSLYYTMNRHGNPKTVTISPRINQSSSTHPTQQVTKRNKDVLKHPYDYSFRQTPRDNSRIEQLTFRQRVEARLVTVLQNMESDTQLKNTEVETQQASMEVQDEQIFQRTSYALTTAIRKLEAATLPTEVKTRFLKTYKNIQKQLKVQTDKLAEQRIDLETRLYNAKAMVQLQMMGISNVDSLPEDDDELTWNKALIGCFIRQLVLMKH